MPLAVPLLTVTNNNDGTVTFTVSSGDAAASNAIKYSRLETPDWQTLTTISGNASGTVDVPPGLKWFAAFATKVAETTVSAPVPAITTLSGTAVFEQCLQAVVAVLQGAAGDGELGEITADRIVRQDVVDLEHLSAPLPAIVVSPGLQETEGAGPTTSDDFTYPILVGLLDRKDENDPANTPLYLWWREVIRQLFHRKRLPGVITSKTTEVQFEIALDHKQDDEDMNLFSTSLRLDAHCRELRWS